MFWLTNHITSNQFICNTSCLLHPIPIIKCKDVYIFKKINWNSFSWMKSFQTTSLIRAILWMIGIKKGDRKNSLLDQKAMRHTLIRSRSRDLDVQKNMWNLHINNKCRIILLDRVDRYWYFLNCHLQHNKTNTKIKDCSLKNVPFLSECLIKRKDKYSTS